MSMHHSTTNTRRILAWILSIAMLLGQMPLSAIAEGVEEILPEPAVTEEVYVEAETEIVPVMEPVLVEEEPAAVIVQATEEPAKLPDVHEDEQAVVDVPVTVPEEPVQTESVTEKQTEVSESVAAPVQASDSAEDVLSQKTPVEASASDADGQDANVPEDIPAEEVPAQLETVAEEEPESEQGTEPVKTEQPSAENPEPTYGYARLMETEEEGVIVVSLYTTETSEVEKGWLTSGAIVNAARSEDSERLYLSFYADDEPWFGYVDPAPFVYLTEEESELFEAENQALLVTDSKARVWYDMTPYFKRNAELYPKATPVPAPVQTEVPVTEVPEETEPLASEQEDLTEDREDEKIEKWGGFWD